MPVTEIPLDSSTREEDVTILHGKNLLLKLIENNEIKQFLSSSELQQILSTDDLAYRDFREMMNRIIRLEDEMSESIKDLGWQVVMTKANIRQLERQLKPLEQAQSYTRALEQQTVENQKELESLKAQMASMRIILESETRRLTGPEGYIASVVKKVEEANVELLRLEEQMKSFNKDVEVLDPTVVLRCSKCGLPVLRSDAEDDQEHPGRLKVVKGEIKRPLKCSLCDSLVSSKDASRIHIHGLKGSVRRLWQDNLWLEEYVSRMLRSMGWRTWSHVYVLGASGVRHEIDVLGVKSGYVILCECKVGNVRRQDVFNFWAKAYDIRSHLSMMALVEKMPDNETRDFLAKNPSVILLESVGEKKKIDIVKELQTSVLSRV